MVNVHGGGDDTGPPPDVQGAPRNLVPARTGLKALSGLCLMVPAQGARRSPDQYFPTSRFGSSGGRWKWACAVGWAVSVRGPAERAGPSAGVGKHTAVLQCKQPSLQLKVRLGFINHLTRNSNVEPEPGL